MLVELQIEVDEKLIVTAVKEYLQRKLGITATTEKIKEAVKSTTTEPATPSRRNKRFSETDDLIIRREYKPASEYGKKASGASIRHLAKLLNRSASSISNRVWLIGLSKKGVNYE